MSDRSRFKGRLDRDVRRGNITERQRRECLKAYDRRQAGERYAGEDALDGAIEGMFDIFLGALGFGRDD